MKTTIIKTKFFPYRYWFFYFKKFEYINGIIIRIFGIEFRFFENSATEKLIKIASSLKK